MDGGGGSFNKFSCKKNYNYFVKLCQNATFCVILFRAVQFRFAKMAVRENLNFAKGPLFVRNSTGMEMVE